MLENYNVKNPQCFFTADTHFGSERALKLSRRPFSSVEEMDATIINNFNEMIAEANTFVRETEGEKAFEEYNPLLFIIGDVGNHEKIKEIDADVVLVLGNYEEEEMKNLGMDYQDYRKYLMERYGYFDVRLQIKLHVGFIHNFMSEEEKEKLDPMELSNSLILVANHKPIECCARVNQLIHEQRMELNSFYGTGIKDERFRKEKLKILQTQYFGLFAHIHGRQKIKRSGYDVGVDANHFRLQTPEDAFFYWNAINKGFYDKEVFC